MTKYQPATPLPWKAIRVGETGGVKSIDVYEIVNGHRTIADCMLLGDAIYADHAANAYPELVEALHTILEAEFGKGNSASKIAPGTYWAKAESVLADLGEIS